MRSVAHSPFHAVAATTPLPPFRAATCSFRDNIGSQPPWARPAASRRTLARHLLRRPPDPATLAAALEALTSAPPPTSAEGARVAAAAVTRLAARMPTVNDRRSSSSSCKLKNKSTPHAFMHGTPSAPALLSDAVDVSEPPALSAVGVTDLSRLLAPPPATLRIEARARLAFDDSADWSDSLGVYKLVDGLAIRGRPVWRHASGRDRWLAFSPRGWMVQNERSLERLQHGAAEWAERLSRAAVDAYLLLEDEFGRPPDLPRPGATWQGWNGEAWVPLGSIVCSGADALGRPLKPPRGARTVAAKRRGDVQAAGGGVGATSVDAFLASGTVGAEGKAVSTKRSTDGGGTAFGGTATSYRAESADAATREPDKAPAVDNAMAFMGSRGHHSSKASEFLGSGRASSSNPAASAVTDFLIGVNTGAKPRVGQQDVDAALDKILVDGGARAKGSSGKKTSGKRGYEVAPPPPVRAGVPSRMALHGKKWVALGAHTTKSASRTGVTSLHDEPVRNRQRNERQIYDPLRDRTTSMNEQAAADATTTGTSADPTPSNAGDGANGPSRKLSAHELAESVQRLHDRRVSERKERKAAVAAAPPSLPRPLSSSSAGGASSSVDGLLLRVARRDITPSAAEVKRTFKKHDQNGDGFIDATELRAALTELGLPTTDVNRAEAVLHVYDADSNRRLDEREFGGLLGQVNAFLREADSRDQRRRANRRRRKAAVASRGKATSYLDAIAQAAPGRGVLASLSPLPGTAAAFLAGVGNVPSGSGGDGGTGSAAARFSHMAPPEGLDSIDDGGRPGGNVSEFLASSRPKRTTPKRGPLPPEPMKFPKKITRPLEEYASIIERLHKPARSDKAMAKFLETEQADEMARKESRRSRAAAKATFDRLAASGRRESGREADAAERAIERLKLGTEVRIEGLPPSQLSMRFGYDAHDTDAWGGALGTGTGDDGLRRARGARGGGSAKDSGESTEDYERTIRGLRSPEKKRGGDARRGLSDSARRRLGNRADERQAAAKQQALGLGGRKTSSKGEGALQEIIAVCPSGSVPGDELVIALPSGEGLIVTHVPPGVQEGDEFLVRARIDAATTDKREGTRLIRLIERLLGGRSVRGKSREEREAFQKQLGQLIDMLRDAEGDRTKGMAAQQILVQLFGDDDGDDDDDDDSDDSDDSDDGDGGGESDDENNNGQQPAEQHEAAEESEGDESDEDSDSDSGNAIEVVVPRGARGGDRISVRIPEAAGGGVITATVPRGLSVGDAFDVEVP